MGHCGCQALVPGPLWPTSWETRTWEAMFLSGIADFLGNGALACKVSLGSWHSGCAFRKLFLHPVRPAAFGWGRL